MGKSLFIRKNNKKKNFSKKTCLAGLITVIVAGVQPGSELFSQALEKEPAKDRNLKAIEQYSHFLRTHEKSPYKTSSDENQPEKSPQEIKAEKKSHSIQMFRARVNKFRNKIEPSNTHALSIVNEMNDKLTEFENSEKTEPSDIKLFESFMNEKTAELGMRKK